MGSPQSSPTLTLYICYESSVVCGVAPCVKMTLEVHLAFYGDSIVKACVRPTLTARHQTKDASPRFEIFLLTQRLVSSRIFF